MELLYYKLNIDIKYGSEEIHINTDIVKKIT